MHTQVADAAALKPALVQQLLLLLPVLLLLPADLSLHPRTS